MRLRKLGKIFDPTQHALPNGCRQFAQAPQVLISGDRLRIYFSTRAVDPKNGKYLSHVAFVDVGNDLKTILGVSKNAVIPLGGLGCFDEHGIFPMNVLRHGDSVLGYTCGWSRRVSVSVETSIGLAISRDDGMSFQKVGAGPVLTSSLHEPFLVGDAFVTVVNGKFHMWYIFGTGWKTYASGMAPERTYKIGHATSDDGVSWLKEEARQIVADRLGPEESQALPSVISFGNRYHMFFCYRESFDFRTAAGRGYRIGYAWSDDLANWTRDDSVSLPSASGDEWDSGMQCYPHAFVHNGRAYLLYNGSEFGRYGFGAAALEA